ncbi:hypothetical protein [Cysteiniphilum sp. 6C5]|uniref:hypothetical protein n=1 Tax=unclassified Cysteiniphilum TaxID=2610889 RepID=UPI003F86EF6B
MKIKALISGVTLGISTMANANVPHLDPHALPTLGSLIEALNDWESPINATSSQAANAETHANNAESYANSAVQTATSANSTAQQAAKTVSTFDQRLITAEGNATSAKTTASSANEQAANASQTAQAAFDKANGYENRISVAEKNASEAQQTANTAKQTADSAKSSADRVDQFDQRITEAQENAKEANNTAESSKTYTKELDDKYSKKIEDVSDHINQIDLSLNQQTNSRVLYASNDKSLDSLINIAKTKFNNLSANNPVIIKLAAKEYQGTTIPDGIIIDGQNWAILTSTGLDYTVTGNVTFKNLSFRFDRKVDEGYRSYIIEVDLKENDKFKIQFNHVNIAFENANELSKISLITRSDDSQVNDSGSQYAKPIGQMHLYFNNVKTQSALHSPENIILFGGGDNNAGIDPKVDSASIYNSIIGFVYPSCLGDGTTTATSLEVVNSVANYTYEPNKNYGGQIACGSPFGPSHFIILNSQNKDGSPLQVWTNGDLNDGYTPFS